MRGAVAERRQADFDISVTLPRLCPYLHRAEGGWICHFLRKRWFGARGFEADAENLVLDPFVADRISLPLRLRSANAHVWTQVKICVEANFPPASVRVRSAYVWT